MEERLQRSIKQAKAHIEGISDTFHDRVHTESVVKSSLKIAREFPLDPDLIELSAWWHDTGRFYCREGHEQVSAVLAYGSLRKLGLEGNIAETVYNAIVHHNGNPETLEGMIIFDADNLDIISVPRWKRALETGNLIHIEDVIEEASRVDELLLLDASCMVYEEMIEEFKKYVSYLIDTEDRFKFPENYLATK